jgi:hypothetical protein
MNHKNHKKSFFAMTPAEKEAEFRRLDKLDYSQTRPLSAKGKLLWERARRGRPPKPVSERASRVLVSLEPRLLARADAFARAHGMSRSQLVARGIDAVLGAGV